MNEAAQDDPIKAAELRGYARGYQAGKKRKARDDAERQQYRRECAFWLRAFLAALPAFITADGWRSGDKPITSLVDRTEMARKAADHALRICKHRIP